MTKTPQLNTLQSNKPIRLINATAVDFHWRQLAEPFERLQLTSTRSSSNLSPSGLEPIGPEVATSRLSASGEPLKAAHNNVVELNQDERAEFECEALGGE